MSCEPEPPQPPTHASRPTPAGRPYCSCKPPSPPSCCSCKQASSCRPPLLLPRVDRCPLSSTALRAVPHHPYKTTNTRLDQIYIKEGDSSSKPGMEGNRNCYADEHYLPTLFYMVDPTGIANWSVTHVDWSERKWHPKSYRAKDVTYGLLKNITSIDVNVHVTSDDKKVVVMQKPCMWNGMQRPCFLFARKFYPETLQNMLHLFSNYTAIQ